MKNSPNIIFNLKGFNYRDTSKQNAFARCKSSFNLVDYLARKEAMLKNSEIVDSDILMEESFEVAGDWNIAKYAAMRKGSAGAFNLDKTKLDKKDLQEIQKQLRTTKSTVWTGVLSFTPMVAKEFCNNIEQAQKLLQDNLPKLFEGSQLDFENMRMFAAYHVNTQHPHLHIVFWEKEATRLNSKGRLTFNYNNPTKKPYLPKECLSNFKFGIAQACSNSNLDFLKLRDEIRNSVKDDFSNRSYLNLLAQLYEKDKAIIGRAGKQFGRLTAAEQKQVNKSVDALINCNPNTKKTFDLYKALLMQTHLQNIKLLNDNNMPVPERTKKFYDTRINELRTRLGNEYLKNMKEFAKAHENFVQSRSKLDFPPNGQSSSNFMRGIRRLKQPLKQNSNIIIQALQRSIKDDVILFKNNLDRYFEELKAKGVSLIYEENGQSVAGGGETFE